MICLSLKDIIQFASKSKDNVKHAKGICDKYILKRHGMHIYAKIFKSRVKVSLIKIVQPFKRSVYRREETKK